jgi:hypothetical protein
MLFPAILQISKLNCSLLKDSLFQINLDRTMMSLVLVSSHENSDCVYGNLLADPLPKDH